MPKEYAVAVEMYVQQALYITWVNSFRETLADNPLAGYKHQGNMERVFNGDEEEKGSE